MEIKITLNADNTMTYGNWTIETYSEIYDEFYGMSRTVYRAHRHQNGQFVFIDDCYNLKDLVNAINKSEA